MKKKNIFFSDASRWCWKPKEGDAPKKSLKPKRKAKKVQRQNHKPKIKPLQSSIEFYTSDEWRSLRMKVIEKNSGRCMACGRSPRVHGVVIHVDHIKPRSKYPQLSLAFDNMQLLCEDCNIGKGNKYTTDWRPANESQI